MGAREGGCALGSWDLYSGDDVGEFGSVGVSELRPEGPGEIAGEVVRAKEHGALVCTNEVKQCCGVTTGPEVSAISNRPSGGEDVTHDLCESVADVEFAQAKVDEFFICRLRYRDADKEINGRYRIQITHVAHRIVGVTGSMVGSNWRNTRSSSAPSGGSGYR